MNTKFLTGREIAEILRVSKSTAYNLIASGQIQCIRFSRSVRVKEEDLEAFIAKNSVGQSHLTGEETTRSPKR